MKANIQLQNMTFVNNVFVPTTLNSLATQTFIRITDIHKQNNPAIDITSNISIGYFRTNKLRETEVKAIFNLNSNVISIDAMNASQYLDIDEYITFALTITKADYTTYSQIIKLYNYDKTFSIYMLPETISYLPCSKFEYLYIPYTNDIQIIPTSNARNVNYTYKQSGSIISTSPAFTHKLYAKQSIELTTETLVFNEITKGYDTYQTVDSVFNIIPIKYLPSVTVNFEYNSAINNLLQNEIPYNKSFNINANLNITDITKLYIDGILKLPISNLGIELEIKGEDGHIEFKQSILQNTIAAPIITYNTFTVPPITTVGRYNITVKLFYLSKIEGLRYTSNLEVGDYNRYVYMPSYPLFTRATLLDYGPNAQDFINTRSQDGYMVRVDNLYKGINQDRYFEIIPNTPGGAITYSYQGSVQNNLITTTGVFLNNFTVPDISLPTLSVQGVAYEKSKTYFGKDNTTLIINGTHKVIEKYQNVIEINAYINIKYSLYKMDDDKQFVLQGIEETMATNDVKLITLDDGIYKLSIFDVTLNTFINYVFVCYPTIIQGNIKYIRDILENIPKEPHKTYYDFSVFVTLRDTFMKKLNNLNGNAIKYVNAELSDTVVSDLYIFKDLLDNIKKYVTK